MKCATRRALALIPCLASTASALRKGLSVIGFGVRSEGGDLLGGDGDHIYAVI